MPLMNGPDARLLNIGAAVDHIADRLRPRILQRLKHILYLLRRSISLFDHIDHGIGAIRQDQRSRCSAVHRPVDLHNISLG